MGLKKLPAAFFETGSGNLPVGMPLCRSLGTGLWEIRSNISSGRIARVIFAVVDEQMVLLHGFVKKTRKTPRLDLDLALTRKKEITP